MTFWKTTQISAKLENILKLKQKLVAAMRIFQVKGNRIHVYDNKNISKTLLSFFPPPLPTYLPPSTDNIEYRQLPSAPLTNEEVRDSIFHTKPLWTRRNASTSVARTMASTRKKY